MESLVKYPEQDYENLFKNYLNQKKELIFYIIQRKL